MIGALAIDPVVEALVFGVDGWNVAVSMLGFVLCDNEDRTRESELGKDVYYDARTFIHQTPLTCKSLILRLPRNSRLSSLFEGNAKFLETILSSLSQRPFSIVSFLTLEPFTNFGIILANSLEAAMSVLVIGEYLKVPIPYLEFEAFRFNVEIKAKFLQGLRLFLGQSVFGVCYPLVMSPRTQRCIHCKCFRDVGMAVSLLECLEFEEAGGPRINHSCRFLS